tara:strand:- start:126 stop:800 length:675 start_codon:yes stop_codon:yes gene_type:complete
MKAHYLKYISTAFGLIALTLNSNCASAEINFPYENSNWVIGINVSGVMTDENLSSVYAAGEPIPNSNLSIDNDTTISLNISYFTSDNLAINFFTGVPASAKLNGKGTLSDLFIGETDYGPIILSLQYHFSRDDNLSPYIGAGFGRVIFMNETDRELSNFDIKNTWSTAIQAGLSWKVDSNWSTNLDIRYVPFDIDITGNLGPAAVKGEVDINATILSFGISYLF